MSYLSHVTCLAHVLPFSSNQFYDILHALVVIYFVVFFFSTTINTRSIELIGFFQNYLFWVNYNVSIWEWDWVEEKTFDNCIEMKGAFHLGKTPGNFGESKSGISDW